MILCGHRSASQRITWQDGFLELLPELTDRLRRSFRDLAAEARADAIENGLVYALVNYRRLWQRGRAHLAPATTLARFAALQIRRGRIACTSQNSKEVLSRYAQFSRGFRVLPFRDESANDALFPEFSDSRSSSVAEQVAFKLDFTAWLSALRRRQRVIAIDLAVGFTTREAARKYGLSPGRISQLRQEFQKSWRQFQGEV